MPDVTPKKSAERQERLAAELRENLKKRKTQARARRQTTPEEQIPDGAEPDLREQDPSAKA